MRSQFKALTHFVFAVLLCSRMYQGSAELFRGGAWNMPPKLQQKLSGYISQGFSVISWEVSPAQTHYRVELYHYDPVQADPTNEGYQDRSRTGMGLVKTTYVPR